MPQNSSQLEPGPDAGSASAAAPISRSASAWDTGAGNVEQAAGNVS
jgi:hypothetical protein